MEESLKKMVLSYDLNKNQTYVKRLLKEGELQGYKEILKLYSSNLDDTESNKHIISIIEIKILNLKEELCILKAKERILNEMNEDLENILSTMDISDLLKKAKYPKDVQTRIDNGQCALKRPGSGKGGFVCDEPVVPGTKYCKKHLLKFDKISYTDIFPEDSENE